MQLPLTEGARSRLSESEPATVAQLIQRVQKLRAALPDGPNASTVIDEPHVAQFIQDTPTHRLEPKEIVRLTAQYFGLKPRNLTGTSRRKMDVLARSIAMFLMRELTPRSFQQVGNAFGKRDHTTVMHACKKVESQKQTDPMTRSALREVTCQLIAAADSAARQTRPASVST